MVGGVARRTSSGPDPRGSGPRPRDTADLTCFSCLICHRKIRELPLRIERENRSECSAVLAIAINQRANPHGRVPRLVRPEGMTCLRALC